MIVSLLGFHRSLTSAISQWLHKSGLPMGTYLIPGHLSNPDGHYEDKLAVDLHDRLLASAGSDWRYHGEADLPVELGELWIKRYINHRNSIHGDSWGVKDPRQCLFLPSWDRALGDSGRYLVVLRHWSGSVQSLFKRHSDVLVESCGRGEVHSSFWREPDLAANMWLAYNRRLLAFLKDSDSSKRVVVTQQSVLGGLPLLKLLNEAFGIQLDAATPSPLRSSLSHDRIDESILSVMSSEKVVEMESVWQELLVLADYKLADEKPVWFSSKDRSNEARKLELRLLEVADSTSAREGMKSSVGDRPPESLKEKVRFSRFHPEWEEGLESLWRQIESEARFDAELWETMAVLLARRGQPEKAQQAVVNVFLSGNRKPYLYMMLGDCRMALLDFPGAAHFYRLAIAANPDNPRFYSAMASLLMILGRYTEAEALIREALTRKPTSAQAYQILANTIDLQGGAHEAIELLEEASGAVPGIEATLFALRMKVDYESGLRAQSEWRLAQAGVEKSVEGLAEVLSTVDDAAARKDLAIRFSKGLAKLYAPSIH